MYERFSEDGKVICQVCGKKYGSLVGHIPTHNITVTQYKDKYSDYPLNNLPWSTKQKQISKMDLFQKIIEENEKIEKIRSVPKEVKPEVIKDELIVKSDVNKIKSRVNKIDKEDIYYKLKESYPNLVLNYSISKKRNDGILQYQFITDMADPIKKIDFEFPDTFWHNIEVMQNTNRDEMLKKDGWRILKFKGVKPNMKEIEKNLDSISD